MTLAKAQVIDAETQGYRDRIFVWSHAAGLVMTRSCLTALTA